MTIQACFFTYFLLLMLTSLLGCGFSRICRHFLIPEALFEEIADKTFATSLSLCSDIIYNKIWANVVLLRGRFIWPWILQQRVKWWKKQDSLFWSPVCQTKYFKEFVTILMHLTLSGLKPCDLEHSLTLCHHVITTLTWPGWITSHVIEGGGNSQT